MRFFEPLAEPVAVHRPAVIAKFSAAFADVSTRSHRALAVCRGLDLQVFTCTIHASLLNDGCVSTHSR